MQQAIRSQLSLLKINHRVAVKIAFCITTFIIVASSFTIKEEEPVSVKLDEYIIANTSEVLNHLDSIGAAFNAAIFDRTKCRKNYEAARKYYKEIEYYIEYNFSFHSKYFINAPLVNKAEAEFNYKTFVPHGFQVLENIIYSTAVDSTVDKKYELALLKQSFEYVRAQSKNKIFKRSAAVDMLRFEIIRIMSLYLNGYDCTVNKQNLSEIKNILKGFTKTIRLIPATELQKENTTKIISQAILYLSQNKDYDAFNRLHFIVHYLKPLYEDLYNFYDRKAKEETTNYAINIRQKNFYGKSWFNTNFFSVVLKDSNLVNQQAELGRLLFFDPLLSGNNKRACASCHNPDHAFGGSADFNLSFGEEEKLKRNTPSLLNVIFQKSFFDDGRSMQLEDQVSDVLTNHNEMFANPEDVVFKLKQSPGYKKLFQQAFENTEDTAITFYAVLKSISEYERKLIALNSRFDKYIRGDETQLTKEEVQGYTVFAGKGLCGSCHFFPLFNGVTPPFYSDNEFEVIGVPKDKSNKEADADMGRYNITKNKIHEGAFKTVNIRNIDKTGPYMHNGAYTTLDEIIEFYRKGGGAGLGLGINNQTLPFDSLQLNPAETDHLKKFLLTLTDKSFKPLIPQSLPVVNIKGLEKRTVGGSY